MYDIKAKPTHYKDYNFRSRLEVKWAIFFDALEIKWKYELKKFPYKKTSYLPDFYLPEFNLWIEIKPKKPTTLEQNKAQTVADQTGEYLLIFAGFPNLQKFRNDENIINLELSDSYIMLCIPNMSHKLVLGINDVFHLLNEEYKLKIILILTVFNIKLQSHNQKSIMDLMTIGFVENNIKNNKLTQYDWHDHLNKHEVEATHSFIVNLPEHISNGLVEIKSLFVKKIQQSRIRNFLKK